MYTYKYMHLFIKTFINRCIKTLWPYLGLRSGGPKQVTVGISSFLGFSSTSHSAWPDAEAGAAVRWLACSLFAGGFGDTAWPWTPRLRLGERQCRKALNCRSSSPSRFPRDVRRTGLLRLGSSRLRRERVLGERWKESSEASPFVSTMDGSLGSCSKSKTGSWKKIQ